MSRIIDVLLTLILEGTGEKLRLAVETSKVLLDKNFGISIKNMDHLRCSELSGFYKIINEVGLPVCQKRLFQFVYHLLDAGTEERIFDLIYDLFQKYKADYFDPDLYNGSAKVLIPFVSTQRYAKEALEICWEDESASERQNEYQDSPISIASLKESCRDVIRCQMAQRVDSPKDIMKRVLDLPLPVVLKCYLLHICDES